jgi:lipopolysaccharide/colanic/teichoic acid biosynthesis glycosyltransferase
MAPRPEAQTHQYGYKRPFDLSLLFFAHITLLPIWLLLWIIIPALIYIQDRGAIFYRQDRVGKHGKVFALFKFRTMVPGSQELGPFWTTRNDPRITPIGMILRKTALDELPGLLSILKGDMSFVGPRALNVDEQNLFESQIPEFNMRLSVPPGLTGMAQIYDRTDDAPTKLHYDLKYINYMGIWFDSKLLIRSLLNTIFGRWDNRSGKDDTVKRIDQDP